MLGTVLRYEWKRIARSARIALLLGAVFMGAFAALEGAGWKRFQERALDKAAALQAGQEASLFRDALAADTGLGPVPLGSPLHGVSLYWTRRYAQLAPGTLAALSVGQSDIEPYYAVFNGVEPNVLLFPEEIRNPMGLLHGRWDARFLVVLLLPLLLIALGFDLAAEERENGTLRLLGAGLRSLPRYFFLRAAAHLGLVGGAGLGGFLLALSVADPAAFSAWPGLLLFVAGACAHLAFWSALCLWINAWRRSAGFNLAVLFLLWAALSFLVPTGLECAARLAHPLPSRNEQALALRTLTSASKQDRPKLLAELRRGRPELFTPPIPPPPSGVPARPAAPLEWYPGFLAEQAYLRRVADSLESRMVAARAEQERRVDPLRRILPPLVLEDLVLSLSGRSPSALRQFPRELEAFRARSQEFVWPRLLQSLAFSPEALKAMPHWQRPGNEEGYGGAGAAAIVAVMLLPAAGLGARAWFLLRRPG